MSSWKWYIGVINSFGDCMFEADFGSVTEAGIPISKVTKLIFDPAKGPGLIPWIGSIVDQNHNQHGILHPSSIAFCFEAGSEMVKNAMECWTKDARSPKMFGSNGIVIAQSQPPNSRLKLL
jgi:hypothetical protein